VENQSPWILDSGAFDHISSSTSLLSSISSPIVPHFITLPNGSKVGQVPLSPPLNLNFVLLDHTCSKNLISLNQLTNLFNCSFDTIFFVVQE